MIGAELDAQAPRIVGDILEANDYATAEECEEIGKFRGYQEMRYACSNDPSLRIRRVSPRYVAHDPNGEVASAIIEVTATHIVERGNGAHEEQLTELVEIPHDNAKRLAIIVQGPDDKAYAVTRTSDALYDNGPISPDERGWQTAIRLFQTIVGPKRRTHLMTSSPQQRLFTSPGLSTECVDMSTTILAPQSYLTRGEMRWFRLMLRLQGMAATPLIEAAAKTADMATFQQLTAAMTGEEMTAALEMRAKLQEKKPPLPDKVPEPFLHYVEDAQNLSDKDKADLFELPCMREACAKLQRAGFDQINVAWARLPAKQDQPAFVMVTGGRREATGEEVVSPLLIRNSAEAGMVQMGSDILEELQTRLATGSSNYPEVLAGTRGKNDPEDAGAVILREAGEESGGIISDKADVAIHVTGLHPSTRSTEAIAICNLAGSQLTEEERNRLLGGTFGLANEGEATRWKTAESLGALAAGTPDLKSRTAITAMQYWEDCQQY